MESYLLARSVLLCEMRQYHHLCGAGGDGRGGGAGRVPLIVRFPRWPTAAARPLLRLITVARPPAAMTAGSPGPWVERNDDNAKVNVFKVIYWSASEAVEFMQQSPPPPLGVHDMAKLRKTFEELVQTADTESREAYYATYILLLNHWHLWETYAIEPVKGCNGPRLFLHDCVKFACADGYIRYEYLHTFGLSLDSLPKDNFDRDLIAAILYVSKLMRKYVREYRKRLGELQLRKETDDREEAGSLKEEQENSGGLPELGAGGI